MPGSRAPCRAVVPTLRSRSGDFEVREKQCQPVIAVEEKRSKHGAISSCVWMLVLAGGNFTVYQLAKNGVL
ncbi:Hypothetical predicted protein [Marmota monax]|uniref:Uncharacterized protein n=1 Tax=Marmota monax TaxID=9995 RepID=A0A5E4BR41_MARMO|nr:Hypothetical predicted protein [Marmota monax]